MKKYFSLLCVCVFVGNLNAQITYDVFTYTEPVGYKKEIGKDYISYTKIDAATGTYCIIGLYRQTKSSGSIKTDFDNEWQKLAVNPFQISETPKAGKANTLNDWQMYVGSANFTSNKLPAMAILATVSNKINCASIICIPTAKKYMPEIDSFFKTIQLQKNNNASNNKTKDTTPINNKPAVKANGIEGVWISYNNRNILTDRVKFNWRIFFNDRTSLLTIPDGGLYNFTNAAGLDNYWGTYNYSNKKGILKYGNNSQFKDDLKWSSTDIILIQGEEYRKCISVNGSKLNGSFSWYPNGNASQNKFPYGQNPKITFTATGKFTDEGLFYQILKDYTKDDTYNGAGKGTYELKDFSIILNYDDGRTKQTSFTIPASETTAKTDLILIGRGSFFKMK